jgi:hypothetical protein
MSLCPTAAGILTSWPTTSGAPSVVPYYGRVLKPWAMAAASPLYKGATAAAAGPSLPPSSSESSAVNSLEHFWPRYVFKFSLVSVVSIVSLF